jgi:hypothetical protein
MLCKQIPETALSSVAESAKRYYIGNASEVLHPVAESANSH